MNQMNQKEVALQKAIREAWQQYSGEFYFAGSKVEEPSIQKPSFRNCSCVSPDKGYDSCNWDLCKEWKCDVTCEEFFVQNPDGNGGRIIEVETSLPIDIKLINYDEEGEFTVRIKNDKIYFKQSRP